MQKKMRIAPKRCEKMEMQNAMIFQNEKKVDDAADYLANAKFAQNAAEANAEAAATCADKIVTSKFIQNIRGKCVAIRGNDVDTDRIAPARFLKAITFEGFGKIAFYDERYGADGLTKGHAFDLQRHAGAAILFANRNFGCGSSREHAPQALMRWGIRAIVAESFASIFADNCTAIGLPTVTVSHDRMEELMARCEQNPQEEAVVSIERMQIEYCNRKFSFEQNASQRSAFLCGRWDSLNELLEAKEQVLEIAQAIEDQKPSWHKRKKATNSSGVPDKPKVQNSPEALLEYGRSVK